MPEATSEPRLAKSKYKSKKGKALAMAADAAEAGMSPPQEMSPPEREMSPPRDTSSPDEEPLFAGADVLGL